MKPKACRPTEIELVKCGDLIDLKNDIYADPDGNDPTIDFDYAVPTHDTFTGDLGHIILHTTADDVYVFPAGHLVLVCGTAEDIDCPTVCDCGYRSEVDLVPLYEWAQINQSEAKLAVIVESDLADLYERRRRGADMPEWAEIRSAALATDAWRYGVSSEMMEAGLEVLEGIVDDIASSVAEDTETA